MAIERGVTVKSPPMLAPSAGLEVRDLSVRYGGVIAVDEVSLKAPARTITGLIGPNGAGKTSLFAACSGLVRPASGKVLLGGHDVTGEAPPRRARRGLGRTFQRVELYDSLTVADNVALGCEAAMAGGKPWSQLFSRPGDRRLIKTAVRDAMAIANVADLADRQVGLLSTGQRRLVELARTLAGPYKVLLLDEPSSGLDAGETRVFGETLRRAVSQRGIGILLVEHDMSLVRDVCSNVYVLEYGALIFEGPPDDMHTSEIVRAAYLGTDVPNEGVVVSANNGSISCEAGAAVSPDRGGRIWTDR
jgi:ABC-type branched-subunit amino acid transport system ATPase component